MLNLELVYPLCRTPFHPWHGNDPGCSATQGSQSEGNSIDGVVSWSPLRPWHMEAVRSPLLAFTQLLYLFRLGVGIRLWFSNLAPDTRILEATHCISLSSADLSLISLQHNTPAYTVVRKEIHTSIIQRFCDREKREAGSPSYDIRCIKYRNANPS